MNWPLWVEGLLDFFSPLAVPVTITKTIAIQTILGVTADGVWGPRSQEAVIAATRAQKEDIQNTLGLPADGIWGRASQDALNKEVHSGVVTWQASSFADLADLAAYQHCKARGMSDHEAFNYGDNGIGQFGKITAQDTVPMVAVNAQCMTARWGSIWGAAHRPVTVTVNGKTISATVEDRISAPGRIDLNPACAKRLGLVPPFLVPCSWAWA